MQTQTLGLTLMSISIVQYGVIPLLADLNATHACNPRWPLHARFHVVTQVLTSTAIAALAMYLLWATNIHQPTGICIATMLSSCVLGAFFISAAFKSLYGGALSDAVDGIAPVAGVDLNAVNFGISLLLLLTGRYLV
jgi:hypothetical protein